MYLYLYMVHRNDDNEGLQDLWCSESDYARMKLARKESVKNVQEMASFGVPVSYNGDGDDGSSEDECLIGIEHLLSTKTVLDEVIIIVIPYLFQSIHISTTGIQSHPHINNEHINVGNCSRK